jgi:hypothetical protein
MSEIATYPDGEPINKHTPSTFISANYTMTLLKTSNRHHMRQFYKRAVPFPMTSTPITAPKLPEQTKLSRTGWYRP